MTIEFGVGLLGQVLSAIALLALLALAVLLRRVSLPSVLLLSRWVRPLASASTAEDPTDEDRYYTALPKHRLWVQNLDGAPLLQTKLTIRVPGRGFIRAVRANGGAGEWEPQVVPPGRTDQAEPGVLPNDWIVHCPAGMRPHATWRIEVAVEEDTPEIAVRLFRDEARFGRQEGRKQTGPAVSGHSLGLLLSAGMSVAALAWQFLGTTPESTTLVLVSFMLVFGWALILFLLVRPVQAGVMSGWAGVGRGYYVDRLGEPRALE